MSITAPKIVKRRRSVFRDNIKWQLKQIDQSLAWIPHSAVEKCVDSPLNALCDEPEEEQTHTHTHTAGETPAGRAFRPQQSFNHTTFRSARNAHGSQVEQSAQSFPVCLRRWTTPSTTAATAASPPPPPPPASSAKSGKPVPAHSK